MQDVIRESRIPSGLELGGVHYFLHPRYFGRSNGMELEGVRYLIERWKASPGLRETVLGYVHDRDGKTAFSRSINMGQARIS
jgi:hypothetical protein